MSRGYLYVLFFTAIFLQAGAYGLTFMLPRLFDSFGADEKVVGSMLFATTISTIVTVYFSGHLSDYFGRQRTLSGACIAISVSLFLYGFVDVVGISLVVASLLLGFGWGLTYSPVLAAVLEGAGFSVRHAFFVTAALCIVSAILFLFLDRPIKAHAINPRAELPSRITRAALSGVIASRSFLPIMMICLGASVFAGMINFQTVFADARGLNYASFFLIYTITVVVFRLILSRFKGGTNPYRTIAVLLYVMSISVVIFIFSGASFPLYMLVAVLFAVGYGISYPLLVTVTANDAEEHLSAQTLQLFALTYFIGIFGFPLIAGWFIVELGTWPLLAFVAALALIEATLALRRSLN